MKRNVTLRLKLHRETVRVLASPELEGAQGGGTIIVGPPQSVSCNVSCRVASCTPQTCNVICSGICTVSAQVC
ncbi:MAG TPA: hypothetical protein VIE43_13955 [Thermoanaerobaculia bacterium]|jgi:hypothetical protein|nr:hypothetical protein [Thermoanaerobaculia bacterium]